MAAAESSPSILSTSHVTRTFFRAGRESARNFDAVSDVSLDLFPGEICCLQGRSGSGKSTLLACMAGLSQPDSGMVEFEGTDLYSLSDADLSSLRTDNFGIVPQSQAPLFDLTVLENVLLPCYMKGNSEKSADRALELLKRLGIGELSESYPAELSGGELRRMAIVRALASEPRVLFADEPTSDLDDETTRDVFALFRDAADAGLALLLVTHETDVSSLADRIFRMDAGSLSLDLGQRSN